MAVMNEIHPFILDILKHNLFTVQLKETRHKLEGVSNGLMCIVCINDACFVDIVATFQLEVIYDQPSKEAHTVITPFGYLNMK